MMNYADRRGRLLESLDVDAFLVVNLEGTDPDGPSMRYLTGYAGYGALVLTPRRSLPLASRTNIGQAMHDAPDLEWRVLDWDYPKAIAEAVDDCRAERIGVAARRIGFSTARALGAQMETTIVVLEDPVAELRQVKDADEVAAIRRATDVTERALTDLLRGGIAGVTESELALQLEFAMRRLGAEGVAFELIVAGGAATALPHHRPERREIHRGEAVLFDIGARVDGYCSDITRTVFVGDVEPELRRVYRVVLAANGAGIEALQPGRSGAEADRAARDVIERAGYGAEYTHGLSHGLGLEIHEFPTSSGPHAVSAYVPGMVVTAEPGVYIPGKGGVRIEDVVSISERGPEVLSRFPKDEPIVVG
ncbi:MAG: aminopeptidase P family protein [Candidatus Bipolaricaulis sp.]|nr:aminopeptidase P family protein [Candidatus Bipolaricaulis sp.]MDD5645900.1 aminopeptidase P family protein [Candidatus Bipolaricaulis sp.]